MSSSNSQMPKSVSVSLIIITVLAIAYTLNILSAVFMPIIVALLFAAFLEPIVKRMVAIKIPRVLAIIIGVAVSLIFIAILLALVVTSLMDFFRYFAQITPRATTILNDMIDSNLLASLNIDPIVFREMFSISTLLNRFISELSSTIVNFTNSGVNFFSSVFMITLFTVFFLLEINDFSHVVLTVMGSKSAHTFASLGEEISTQIGRYLYVKTLVSAMTGIAIFALSSLVGLNFAIMWGLLGFLLNYIPVVGSAVVVVGSMLAAILQFYNAPLPLLTTLIGMPVIQVIFGNILDPRMQGKSLDLSPSLVLISLAVWGAIWGIPGMFLSVPATVLIKITLNKFESTRGLAALMGTSKKNLQIQQHTN
ncbi:AI-2E family transporter [Entomospira entomophila]|uniref:AI-2E family transporter n=1 Tax=Entomospira entomophila TaxID=2719988 RepID=A0A968G8H1_9SPIO|nr:AI-2E family transporter [Entomospira entomophilus]NIZ40512.1 AI-2E family transporter [Entomospira entomophilus]WDI36071.1 AI-2E family transporter [Entomospira entomophilus]